MKRILFLLLACFTLSASAQTSYLDSLKTYIDYEKVKALVMVNGKKYKKPIELIDSTKIKSFSITMGEAAIERFGESCVNGAIDIQLRKESDKDSIEYRAIDTPARFRGGDRNAFRNWAIRNASYPNAAFRSNSDGVVVISFVVNKDGTVGEVKIESSNNRLFNAETLRVVSSSPIWTPGSYKGEPMRVKYSIPFHFKTQGGSN